MALLQNDDPSTIPLLVPLLPVVGKFHIDCTRRLLNHNSLLCLADVSARTIIASIICLNFHKRYNDSLILVLIAEETRRDFLIEVLTDFSIPPSSIFIMLKETRKKLQLPTKGIMFTTLKAFSALHSSLKGIDIKLVVIDEAEKAHGSGPATKIVRSLMQTHKHFRVLGLAHDLDLQKVMRVQSAISNLSITKIYLKDTFDHAFMDALLTDDFSFHPVTYSKDYFLLTKLFEKGVTQYIDMLYMASVISVKNPNWLINGSLDEWRKSGLKTPFALEVKIAYSLLNAYKHLVFSGSHPFYLYLRRLRPKFKELNQALKDNVYLRKAYIHASDIYSKVQSMNHDEKIETFRKWNPKFVNVTDLLNETFQVQNRNMVIVCWSPFVVQSLEMFTHFLFLDKRIHASIFSCSEEEEEFTLGCTRSPNYTELEGLPVDLLIKTGHIDKKSKRRFKIGIAMDLHSATYLRMKIALQKSILVMEPFESVSREYFTFNPNLNHAPYHFFENAFRMESNTGKALAKFDSIGFPTEFIPEVHDSGKETKLKKAEELFTDCLDMFTEEALTNAFGHSGQLNSTLNSTIKLEGFDEEPPLLPAFIDDEVATRKRPAAEDPKTRPPKAGKKPSK